MTPPRCPLKTGVLIPECRFSPRLFRQLHAEGVFAEGCPIEKVCRMKRNDNEDLPESC